MAGTLSLKEYKKGKAVRSCGSELVCQCRESLFLHVTWSRNSHQPSQKHGVTDMHADEIVGYFLTDRQHHSLQFHGLKKRNFES